MKIDVKAFAFSCAVVWGIGLVLATWWIVAFDGPSTDPTWLGHLYRGYNLTWTGGLIGGVWGFFDGLIGGAVFAWLYDVFEGRVIHSEHQITAHPQRA
jgi:hypothetical protein